MKTALVLLLSALLFLQSVNGAVKGLNANVSTLCTSGCLWSDATIWTDGIVPTSADNVDIQASGSYIIRLDVDANVTDFDIGVDSYGDTHNFEILAGVTLRSTGQMVAKLTSKVTVFAGASLLITGQATSQGFLVIYGTASFGGSSPSLSINTRDGQVQLPTNIVYATLQLFNGTITVSNNVAITAASEFYGYGSIVGTLLLRGELYPGGSNTVGTLTISENLSMESTAEITIDISDATTFDHVIIGLSSIERGSLFANLLGDYEPLSHSEFVCFNHTSLRNGFETVRGTSLLERISSKWQTIPDQDYTSLLYDDATTVLISFATIAFCLLVSVL